MFNSPNVLNPVKISSKVSSNKQVKLLAHFWERLVRVNDKVLKFFGKIQ